ncbi:MmcQ/YjbR family DNA-binding protein [Nocardioides sp.]|uniref:MmcQ/YjbR family DNA-binding protein n=1 Tax=Nocardioides sp. TaxID=35761 RepID=UPI0037839FF3
MVTADEVRDVGLGLPRTYEAHTGGRAKLKVRQIVYVAFSADETAMGFGYPREARDGLVESDPRTFFLPPARDLRYQWVCAHLGRLDHEEMRELVTDAWRMCTPAMLHELPEMEPPVAAAWNAMDSGDRDLLVDLLDPRLHFVDGDLELRGRPALLAHLRSHPVPRPPTSVAVRDGRIWRWVR